MLIFSSASHASTCFEDMNAPVKTIINYYSDLKKKDISLLAKYFHGAEYRKLETKSSNDFSNDDYEKHHYELLFGQYSLCRAVYKVECENNSTAIVTYTGEKAGTDFKSDESIWLHQLSRTPILRINYKFVTKKS